ncbi:MAG: 3-hydroxyacyl-CoA dehydrogenase family protein [Clostridiales Family XIII bacterium]|jgi:3-hydroxybutyryl-CoA dehydrogenase|nr:3-hydroxyacyl-CoA dehydrogenase family protein [Clostridiales Family XIII bacterium]
MEVKKVAVVGAGTMGNGIAIQSAISGFDTRCFVRKPEKREKAKAYAETYIAKQVKKEKITQEQADKASSNLVYSDTLADAVKDVDLVIEAVVDVLSVKQDIIAEIDALTPDHTIFASNSSYIVASRFADAAKDPSKVANLHFFNPPLIMKLVEVVRGPHVSDDTVDTLVQYVKDIDHIPATVNKEVYGFIVNRIFSAITKEACYIYDQDIANYEDIDNAVKYALNHPMGPFALLDMTGIDLEYDVLTEKYKLTGDLADKPSVTLVEHYAKGEYGLKTGLGFYKYDENKKPIGQNELKK